MKLPTAQRTTLGKKTKNLRKEGLIPAELFGPGSENKHLSVPEKVFVNVFKEAGKSTIIDLEIEGESKAVPVLIHNVQIHPLTRKPLAIDFYRVRADTKIHTEVPIEFTGIAPIISEGFVVVKALNEIEIEAFPQHIPHTIEVDLSKLKQEGDTLYVKDLTLPKNIELITLSDTAVATTSKKQEEEEETPAPSVEEVEITKEKEETPETESNEKKPPA